MKHKHLIIVLILSLVGCKQNKDDKGKIIYTVSENATIKITEVYNKQLLESVSYTHLTLPTTPYV